MSHIYAVVQLNEPATQWPELATAQAGKMRASSQYWQPEMTDQLQQVAPTPLLMGQMLRFNTPFSRFEKVHTLAAAQLFGVANARLDNRPQLLQLLELEPAVDIADGMLILLLYQRFHEQCLQHLLGDFAFIIWDEQRQQLFAACDHFGVKNLFYGRCQLGFMISNEHKALLTAPGLENNVNPAYLVEQWIRLPDSGYISPCSGIASLPPAHYLLVNRDGIQCQRYWQLQAEQFPEFASNEQSIAGLRQRFEAAVQRRLVSQYPVGTELSEGLDSTAITAVAARNLAPAELQTFSYQCEPLNDNNAATYRDILDFAAMYDNIRPQWRDNKPELTEQQLKQTLSQVFGGPAPEAGQWLERYPLITRSGVRTLLSGWGGDHCVSGYADYYEDELMKDGKIRPLYQFLKNKYHRGRGGHPLKMLLRQTLKHRFPVVFRKHLRSKHPMIKLLSEQRRLQPLRKIWVSAATLQQSAALILRYDLDSVQQRDWRELFEIGVHWRLMGSEVTGRFFQLDYRFPMLDKELVEYVYSMPACYKIWQGVERSMFRDAIKGLVTERIRTRLKSDVILPTNFMHKVQQNKQQKLQQLTAELQAHPLIQHFFEPQAFATIPQKFAEWPKTSQRLETMWALCQLYEQGLVSLPAVPLSALAKV